MPQPTPLVIPFTFAAAGLNTPTTQLDADYNACRDYVNDRTPVVGPIGSRPAASATNQGLFWIASDQNNALSVSDGSTWRAVTQSNVAPVVQVVASSIAEATTNSTVAVALVTLTPSVSIATTTLWSVTGLLRKTAGAAAAVSLGLNVNGVNIFLPDVLSSAVNRAEDGFFYFSSPITTGARLSPNYTHAAFGGQSLVYVSATGVAAGFFNPATPFTNPLPTAPITSIVITALTGNAAVTLGIANVVVLACAPV